MMHTLIDSYNVQLVDHNVGSGYHCLRNSFLSYISATIGIKCAHK